MKESPYVAGKISEDLKEAVSFLSDKLGIEEPKGPYAFYNLCKKHELTAHLDYREDTFTVWYELPLTEAKVVTPDPTELIEEEVDESGVDTTTDSSGIDFDDLDDLDVE